MLYVLAIFLGLIMSFESLASEATRGNITHLKNDRELNAGAALFPTIPFIPLVFMGFAWVLQTLVPYYAAYLILIGIFLILSVLWMRSFAKLRKELNQAVVARKSEPPNSN